MRTKDQHPFIKAIQNSGVGSKIIYLPEVNSTNTYALGLIKQDVENGTVVLTDHQTQGRGRGANHWEASVGKGLTFSIILYPHLPVSYTSYTSLLAGLAVSDALERFNINASLKWPNDIFCNGRKLGGILCESHVQNARLNSIIIGIGLNINETEKNFSPEIRSSATSLHIIHGEDFYRADILSAILESMNNWVNKWASGLTGKIVEAWIEKCNHLGKHVKFKSRNQWVEGVFKGVSEHGEAILEDKSGIQLYSGSDLRII